MLPAAGALDQVIAVSTQASFDFGLHRKTGRVGAAGVNTQNSGLDGSAIQPVHHEAQITTRYWAAVHPQRDRRAVICGGARSGSRTRQQPD